MSSTIKVNDSRTGSVKDASLPGAHDLIIDYFEPVRFYGILEGGGGRPPSTASHAPSSHIASTIDSNRQGALSNLCTLRCPPRDGNSVLSDIAFGDGDATSGFVTESGELICIVQMLDMGPAGFCRARPNYRRPPTHHPFGDIVQGSKSGLGLNLIRDELSEHGSHQIDFVHDRWPRFLSQYQKLDVEIQLCVKDKRVIQHYILRSKDRINVKFGFNAAVNIDDGYMLSELKRACNINGGMFSTGGTAVALAGGAGGHVQFFASLFKDAQPVTLDLSVGEIDTPIHHDLPPSEYFQSNFPTDQHHFKWTSWLRQYEEISMLEGETRTMTAIYHFEFEKWSRSDVYSLHLMPKSLLGCDETEHRMKEEQYMRDLEAATTLGPEASEQFVSDLPVYKEAVPFSNWGGQATSSQRLLGLEWMDSERDYLPYEMQSVFEERFADIRKSISQKHGKVPLSNNIHALAEIIFLLTRQAHKILGMALLDTRDFADTDLKEYLQSNILRICQGHLDWCFYIAQLTPTLTWTSQCRPFGSRISNQVDLAQGAIHFLKLFEATKNLKLGMGYISQLLVRRLESWIDHLHVCQTSKAGLWAASTKVEKLLKMEDSFEFLHDITIPCYYLCDAVLIWQATSAVYDMMKAARSDPDCNSDVLRRLDSIELLYFRNAISSEEMRSKILERFSYDHTFPTLELVHTHDEVSSTPTAKRLLAFSRNGTQKPRFYWNSESMILCEGYDWGFFSELPASQTLHSSGIPNGESRFEQWWSSLNLQKYQQASLWKKPNRYMLALILASNSDFSIDGSKDSRAIFEQCYKVLLRCVLAGGIMATSIDPLTQSPLYMPLGSTASIFDVPHYLLRQQYRDILIDPISEYMKISGLSVENSEEMKKRLSRNYRHEKSVRSLRKRGFYAIVDKAKVVSNPCEPDWLFHDLDIFTDEGRSCDEKDLEEIVDDWQNTYRVELKDMQNFIKRLKRLWISDRASFQRESREPRSLAVVCDVVKSNANGGRKDIRETWKRPRELLEMLRFEPRRKSDIKKRLM
ncbi:MAG: hypothetical protein Q9195_006218 [Heterodermia aff. obscurata]